MNLSKEERDNILIIDDVTSNLVSLADIIRQAGYTARPVASVDQARRTIGVLLPSIILLDVTMPEMNGYDFCRELKKDARTRDIPVIFISGLNTAQDRVKGFECGAVDFISKPFESTEVKMRMNRHLDIAHLQKQLLVDNRRLHYLVNRQLFQIEEERKKMILALANLSEDRDEGTGTHLDYISRNCRLIATGLSLTHKYEKIITGEFISTIEVACRVHDIGKIRIPDRILLKEGPLTVRERAILLTHTTIGVAMLQEIYSNNNRNNFIKMGMDIAHYHHERWDGSGYPNFLKGTAIPLAARIVAVVDTYDALVSPRCYKPGYKHEAAIAAIREESGKAFDPDVVSIFCRLEKRLVREEDANAHEISRLNISRDTDARR